MAKNSGKSKSTSDRLEELVGALNKIQDELKNVVGDKIDTLIDPVGGTHLLMRQAQEMLIASESRYRQIVENAFEGVWKMDNDFHTIYTNPKLRLMLGYSAAEMEGRSFFDFMEENAAQKFKDYIARRQRGINEHHEFKLLHKEGQPIWVLLSISPIPSGLLAMVVDLTERKRLEAQIIQSQKMDAIGQLAGGIAHDFNNLLAAILLFATQAKDEVPDGSRAKRNLSEICKVAERGAGLTRQLLTFSRQQASDPKVIDFNQVLIELYPMFRRLVGENIELEILPSSGAIRSLVDKAQIQQVFLNLVVNAKDAMPDGGNITFTIESVDAEGQSPLLPNLTAGKFAVISVKDRGTGIPPEAQPHVFEPFFTTKGVNQGTGLGLATVYGIIQQSGGHIFFDSQVGQGTTFTIYLPQVDGELVEDPFLDPLSETEVKGSETILLVEDADLLREVISQGLRELGYNVLTADNGSEALAKFQESAGEIDLLLTDVVMPSIGGQELAHRLRADHPEIKILFMSGYTEDFPFFEECTPECCHYIQKPFLLKDLAVQMREILD